MFLQRYLIYNLKATYNNRKHGHHFAHVFAKILNLQLESNLQLAWFNEAYPQVFAKILNLQLESNLQPQKAHARSTFGFCKDT